jgi:hypothetical protein
MGKKEKMIKRWLAFDIGCIECGEESGVIGTFDTEAEAEHAADAAEIDHEKNWHGQHCFMVYDLGATEPDESHPEWEACK